MFAGVKPCGHGLRDDADGNPPEDRRRGRRPIIGNSRTERWRKRNVKMEVTRTQGPQVSEHRQVRKCFLSNRSMVPPQEHKRHCTTQQVSSESTSLNRKQEKKRFLTLTEGDRALCGLEATPTLVPHSFSSDMTRCRSSSGRLWKSKSHHITTHITWFGPVRSGRVWSG